MLMILRAGVHRSALDIQMVVVLGLRSPEPQTERALPSCDKSIVDWF